MLSLAFRYDNSANLAQTTQPFQMQCHGLFFFDVSALFLTAEECMFWNKVLLIQPYLNLFLSRFDGNRVM